MIHRYSVDWHLDDPVEMELCCIRSHLLKISHVQGPDGRRQQIQSPGLFHHIKAFSQLCWPWFKWHRWSELMIQEFIANQITCVHGPKDSGKSATAALYVLSMYCALPEKTIVLVSSTDKDSLELRVWGEIKMLHGQAQEISQSIPGHPLHSRQMILTDAKDAFSRDFRKGIVGIPCRIGGVWVGLGRYVGIKQDFIFHLADELQFMPPAFTDSIANLSKKRYKCLGMGNPKDRTDPFGKLSEPKDGWDSLPDEPRTRVWALKWFGGRCIELYGPDSPNCTRLAGAPKIHDKLIDRDDIEQLERFYGKDSYQVQMFAYGRMPKSAIDRRVITRLLCERHRALERVVWDGMQPPTKLLAIDAAYGAVGGDRCVAVELHMGRCVDGKIRLAFGCPLIVIPVSDRIAIEPAEQIATFVRDYCTRPDKSIPPDCVAFDSTGRGSLASALARIWSPACVGIEFGGAPSNRPVHAQLQTKMTDGSNRPILAHEHYFNFMSELWFTWSLLIEADMMRELPVEIMDEAAMRRWWMVARNKIQVEPKTSESKDGKERSLSYKQRLGHSPDASDATVTGIELARRKGLVIGAPVVQSASSRKWMDELREKQRELRHRGELTYSH